MGLLDQAKGVADAVYRKVDEALRSSATAEQVAAADDWLTEQRMSRKVGHDSFRGISLRVHRGYAYADTVKVLVRCSETARVLDASDTAYLEVMKANVRRHWSLPLPGLEVEAELNGVLVSGVSDRHGFVPLTLKVPDLAPGWHNVAVRILPGMATDDPITGSGRVLKPDPASPFLVISDIDDTVIKSGLAEGLSSMRRTLVGNQHTRQAIPGMSSLYRGIARGVPGPKAAAVTPSWFYLSTGSWSFYEMLVSFLQLRGFPRGPLFLTDWGPSERYLHRSGALHKRHTIERLFAAYPYQQFVLIGDSGQADFATYVQAAKDFPGRVRAILIIPAGSDTERQTSLKDEAGRLRGEGVEVHMVDDVGHAAQISYELGLCDELTINEVRTELGAVF